MKKILLLSDTHGFMDERILKYAEEADEIWHAGDIGPCSVTDELKKVNPVKAVYGNIDGSQIRMEFPLHQRFFCEGVDVWITHIGGYPGKYSPAIREEIQQNPPRLFICGHSHILKVIYDQKIGVLHLNPGAAGKQGWHKIRSLLKFCISEDKIHTLEAIELGGR